MIIAKGKYKYTTVCNNCREVLEYDEDDIEKENISDEIITPYFNKAKKNKERETIGYLYLYVNTRNLSIKCPICENKTRINEHTYLTHTYRDGQGKEIDITTVEGRKRVGKIFGNVILNSAEDSMHVICRKKD